MRRPCHLLVLLSLASCNGSTFFKKPDKLYLKYIETDSITIEWYFHSLISSTTPDIVTLEREGRLDTICMTSNIMDVQLLNRGIVLDFYGTPRCRDNEISLPDSVSGLDVVVDTAHRTPGPRFRETFKRSF
jgi:hypothetical protein